MFFQFSRFLKVIEISFVLGMIHVNSQNSVICAALVTFFDHLSRELKTFDFYFRFFLTPPLALLLLSIICLHFHAKGFATKVLLRTS